MEYLDYTPATKSNPEDTFSKYLTDLTGFKISSLYEPELFRLTLDINSVTYELSVPSVKKVSTKYNSFCTGYECLTLGKTSRFFRAVLLHKNVNPFFNKKGFYLHKIPGEISKELSLYFNKEDFYLADYWTVFAEIIAPLILKHKEINLPKEFNTKFSALFNKEELINNPWGSLIMSQEIKIGIPDKEDCIVNFKPQDYSYICKSFQVFSLSKGYSLSATSKSKPGTVLTRGLLNTPSKRTLLSHILMPSSVQRWCRAPREQRALRESIKFFKSIPPNIFLKEFKIEDSMKPYLHNSGTLIMDTTHNVPSAEEGTEWTPNKDQNKDRIMLCPKGSQSFRTIETVNVSVTEERFNRNKAFYESQDNYVFLGCDNVMVDSYYSRTFNCSYTKTEPVVKHAKLVSITGLKGVTEPLFTRFYVSHLPNLETLNITSLEDNTFINLLEQRVLIEVETIISASGVYSKRSDALIHHAVLSRLAYDKGYDTIIPNLKASEWCCPERSEEVDTEGKVSKRYEDHVQKISDQLKELDQDPTGKMFVYKFVNNTFSVQKHEDGSPMKAVFGYIPFFRTRHSDEYGSETLSFIPNQVDSTRTRGVSYDIHIATLGNMDWFITEPIKNRINNMANSIKLLDEKICQGF